MNTESKPPVELPEIPDLPDFQLATKSFPVTPADTFDAAGMVGRERLKQAASDFIGRMEARLERDRERDVDLELRRKLGEMGER